MITAVKEQWKDVVGYEGLYQVSDMGVVKRIAIGQGSVSGRILKHRKRGEYKHLGVVLYKNKKPKAFLIHRLVLVAFRGLCPNGMEARHLNGNGGDNRIDNLSWDTHSVNMQDRKSHGTTYNGDQKGSSNPSAKINEKKVKMIKKHLREGKLRGSQIARLFEISPQAVCCIKKGRNWGWLDE